VPGRITIVPYGDCALRVDFPLAAADGAVPAAWAAALRDAAVPGVSDIVPAYDSVTVTFDPSRAEPSALQAALGAIGPAAAGTRAGRIVLLPTEYGGAAGPDLALVAAHAGVDEQEVIRRHSSPRYRVVMIGFMPGFPYLAGLDPSLAVPRKARPRTGIPAGSVGIGGTQTGVYPLASPGGWQIIGRTSVRLFDPGRTPAALLAPGDEVRFVPANGQAVDLNCDLGEGSSEDEELFAVVTSANIACGGHAGDERSMAAAVDAALRHGVAVGAHPGYADREGFGRRELALRPEELAAQVAAQVTALEGVAREHGAVLSHVKLHGALYTTAARDPGVAATVLGALERCTSCRTLFAPAGSQLGERARAEGYTVAEEGFADRAYRPDGTLAPRGEPGAVVHDPAGAGARAAVLARDGVTIETGGSRRAAAIHTICIHGDEPGAAARARAVRAALEGAGFTVQRFGTP
jgi:5-oxoprolinase (ATP-hydrolysing) subunit A